MTIWMLPCSLAALAVSCVAWPDACPGSGLCLSSTLWPSSSHLASVVCALAAPAANWRLDCECDCCAESSHACLVTYT